MNRRKRVLSLSEIENEASNLSSYNGMHMRGRSGRMRDLYEYEGDGQDLALLESYTGHGDPLVDFGGINRSFANEINRGRIYVFTLVNANASTRFAILSPTLVYEQGSEQDGIARTGAFDDEGGNAGLTGSGSPQSIEKFMAWVHANPTRFGGFKVSSTVINQIEQIVTIEKESPFRNLETEEIILPAYTDENNFKDKVVTVPYDFQMDNQTRWRIPVVGSSTVTITFFGGGVLNTSNALDVKASMAENTIAQVGRPAVIQSTRPIGRRSPMLQLQQQQQRR